MNTIETIIRIAAQSVDKLRKCDVYRVLENADTAGVRSQMAAYIQVHRPDLAEEVDECVAEIVG